MVLTHCLVIQTVILFAMLFIQTALSSLSHAILSYLLSIIPAITFIFQLIFASIKSLCFLHSCVSTKVHNTRKLAQRSHLENLSSFYVSGKSTLACALSRELHYRGHLTYVLDGDNLRHGLNRDLSFKSEDRAENIRRVGKF
jgi:hypothetical protein